jgi:hypothetical protein
MPKIIKPNLQENQIIERVKKKLRHFYTENRSAERMFKWNRLTRVPHEVGQNSQDVTFEQ